MHLKLLYDCTPSFYNMQFWTASTMTKYYLGMWLLHVFCLICWQEYIHKSHRNIKASLKAFSYSFICYSGLHLVMKCWSSPWYSQFKSSHPEVFLGKGVLEICSKFTGELLCRNVILRKLLCNFIKITLWHGWSPVYLLYIFRTPFTKKTSRRLLLSVVSCRVFML